MKKIKVLQFTIANAKGSLTQYTLQNWKYIDKNKFRFDFATYSPYLDFADELIAEGCTIHYLKTRAHENEEVFTKEICDMLDEEYDVLHLNTVRWDGFKVEELAMRYEKTKVIIHSHSGGISNTSLGDGVARVSKVEETHEYYKNLLEKKHADYFCACSEKAAKWLYNDRIPKDKIFILNNAIETRKYKYSTDTRKRIREDLRLTERFVIGHVGRFSSEKNHTFLIYAFKRIKESVPASKLILVGDGPDMYCIKKLARECGVYNDTIFMGKRDEVHELYQAMDIFLLPSFYEGLSLVLVEAQASGLKVLASEVSSMEARITENIECLPLDLELWAEKTVQIYREGYHRKDMSDEITKAGYNIDSQIKIIEALYRGEDLSGRCKTAAD